MELWQKASSHGDTLFNLVRTQLEDLVFRFRLTGRKAQVLKAYDLICRESMDLPIGRRPPNFSRINVDGMPFQYSISLGSRRPSLHFLSEVGVPGSSVARRMKLSLERIEKLASLFGADENLDFVRLLINRVIPSDDQALLADPSGALWIGVDVGPEAPPKLTVYINAKWGEEMESWNRLDSFVSHFPEAYPWRKSRGLLAVKMRPLGMAITLAKDTPLIGRVYLSAYGNPLSYYRNLSLSATNERFCDMLDKFTGILLGDDVLYPLRSVVCSYGLGTGPQADFKFELCGHCSLTSDVQAEAKCLEWITSINTDSSPYSILLQTLANGSLNRKSVDLHSYLGIGMKKGEIFSTIYLKPNWSGAVTSL